METDRTAAAAVAAAAAAKEESAISTASDGVDGDFDALVWYYYPLLPQAVDVTVDLVPVLGSRHDDCGFPYGGLRVLRISHWGNGCGLSTMRVELIGHLKTCMTDIYIHIWCAHGRLYPHAPVGM